MGWGQRLSAGLAIPPTDWVLGLNGGAVALETPATNQGDDQTKREARNVRLPGDV